MNNEYQEVKTRIETKFDKELTNVSRVQGDKLFKLAWDYGHAGGDSEIENYYRDLLDLIK